MKYNYIISPLTFFLTAPLRYDPLSPFHVPSTFKFIAFFPVIIFKYFICESDFVICVYMISKILFCSIGKPWRGLISVKCWQHMRGTASNLGIQTTNFQLGKWCQVRLENQSPEDYMSSKPHAVRAWFCLLPSFSQCPSSSLKFMKILRRPLTFYWTVLLVFKIIVNDSTNTLRKNLHM